MKIDPELKAKIRGMSELISNNQDAFGIDDELVHRVLEASANLVGDSEDLVLKSAEKLNRRETLDGRDCLYITSCGERSAGGKEQSVFRDMKTGKYLVMHDGCHHLLALNLLEPGEKAHYKEFEKYPEAYEYARTHSMMGWD